VGIKAPFAIWDREKEMKMLHHGEGKTSHANVSTQHEPMGSLSLLVLNCYEEDCTRPPDLLYSFRGPPPNMMTTAVATTQVPKDRLCCFTRQTFLLKD
jgi:hypothetical protein